MAFIFVVNQFVVSVDAVRRGMRTGGYHPFHDSYITQLCKFTESTEIGPSQ